MQNVVGPTVVAMATNFGLGAEIQSPTGLFNYYRSSSFQSSSYLLLSSKSISVISANHYHVVTTVSSLKNYYSVIIKKPESLSQWSSANMPLVRRVWSKEEYSSRMPRCIHLWGLRMQGDIESILSAECATTCWWAQSVQVEFPILAHL